MDGIMDGIYEIATHYGLPQLDVAQEEMAELIQVISKFKRYPNCEWTSEDIEKGLYEEIADVEIMLEQLKILTCIDEVELWKIKRKKINRQLERIEKENG